MIFINRYLALDQEMEEISQIWKSAKDHLTNQQLEVFFFDEVYIQNDSLLRLLYIFFL